MGKIFCLMGKSSSGKDTVFRELKDDISLELKPIVSYTTRPKRAEEAHGVEYFFVNFKDLKTYREKGVLIEERVYHTTKGDWYYFTVDDGQVDFRDNYIIITTLESYIGISKYYGTSRVIPVYINIDDRLRLERAINRESTQQNPDYNEVCRRFIADNIDFSEKRLLEAGISKYYSNTYLRDCVDLIKSDIKKHINKC